MTGYTFLGDDMAECNSNLATQSLLYTDTIHGDQVLRDDLWVVSTSELNQNQRTIEAAMSRLEEIEEVRKNEEGTWYWTATGDEV